MWNWSAPLESNQHLLVSVSNNLRGALPFDETHVSGLCEKILGVLDAQGSFLALEIVIEGFDFMNVEVQPLVLESFLHVRGNRVYFVDEVMWDLDFTGHDGLLRVDGGSAYIGFIRLFDGRLGLDQAVTN